ncbi:MAG TPA: sugar ABC transporter permease [Baekduia sp.]|nr:sugar ABC transporter permease [Baekduia sp.]
MSLLEQPPVAVEPPEEVPESARRRLLRSLAEGELSALRVVLMLALIWLIFQAQEDRFLSSTNLTNLLLQITSIGCISVGVVLVLLLGEIDLSVGAVSGFTSGIMAVLMVRHGWPAAAAIGAALVVGAAIGTFNGLMVTQFGIPSFVVTLAGSLAWQGGLLYVLGTTGTVNLAPGLVTDLTGTFYGAAVGWALAAAILAIDVGLLLARHRRRVAAGLPAQGVARMVIEPLALAAALIASVLVFSDDRGIPLAVLILVGFVVFFSWLTQDTEFGRHVYATGGNVEAARRAGIGVDRVRVAVFALASTMAAVGGVMAASRLMAVNQSSGGSDTLLLSIAGPVIAGVSLFGGRGRVSAALLGALVIGSISNGMDLLALASSAKYVITGAVLCVAVTIDALARRQRQLAGRH